MARYDAVQDLLDRRQRRHSARKEIAEALAFAVLLARSEAERIREWRHLLNHVLWQHHEPTMRELIAMPETPEWARTVLIEALKQPQTHTKSKQHAAQMVKNALETDPELQKATIIAQSRLEELRAEYAALRLARRATVAA